MGERPRSRLSVAAALVVGMPFCPRCNQSDRVEREDQTDHWAEWFLCERCRWRFMGGSRDWSAVVTRARRLSRRPRLED
jgi:hypothetical protein